MPLVNSLHAPRAAAVPRQLGPSLLLLLALLVNSCGSGGNDQPDVERLRGYQPGGATVLLDKDGHPFANLSPVDRSLIELDELPEHVPNAFIAVEDKRFWRHQGVDVWRVGGAAFHNIRRGRFEEGFSTITMQLARSVFSDQISLTERNVGRKLREMRAAMSIEKQFSKKEILELYLNHVYFGKGAVGIEAASRHYFHKRAAKLTMGEAALLAGMLKAPARFEPQRHPDRARGRRDLVLSLMQKQGLAKPGAAAAARQTSLGVSTGRGGLTADGVVAGYFIEEIRRILETEFGDRLYMQQLKIYTTLDMGLQLAAEEELTSQLANIERGEYGRYTGTRYVAGTATPGTTPSYLQGAIVAMDVASGDVRAWVGGRDIRHSEFDRVANAHRQAGSAFKPFVYAAALSQGVPLTRVLDDQPFRVELASNQHWEPKNFNDKYSGQVTMRNALVRSVNVPTVHLADEVGYRRIAALARQAGIESPIAETPSMALGTVAVSPLELTAAYTTFAGLGRRVAPRLITRVETVDGRVIQIFGSEARGVMSASVAYLINDTLHDALERGSGAPAMQSGFSGPAAGKTGTSSDGVDAWFIGYTPEIVAGVWIGFDDPKRIVSGASGGRLAAPAWGRMMNRYYADSEPPWWQAPSNVVEYAIDPETGRTLEDGCRPNWGEPVTEIFIRGTEPESSCPDSDYQLTSFVPGGDLHDSYLSEDDNNTNDWKRDDRSTAGNAERPEDQLGGSWVLETTITQSGSAHLENLRMTHHFKLRQDGNEVHGEGEKIAENGGRVAGNRHTTIFLSGQLNGDRLRLRFTESGGTGAMSGWFDFRLADHRLQGEFMSTDTYTRGYASARRSY